MKLMTELNNENIISPSICCRFHSGFSNSDNPITETIQVKYSHCILSDNEVTNIFSSDKPLPFYGLWQHSLLLLLEIAPEFQSDGLDEHSGIQEVMSSGKNLLHLIIATKNFHINVFVSLSSIKLLWLHVSQF